MKRDDVPQDDSRTYAGHRKLLYAKSDNGGYEGVQSSGWEPETTATMSAVAEFDRLSAEALGRWLRGDSSPLEYWMYKSRLDIPTLAQITGLFSWRVKRHLRPEKFQRLPQRVLDRYIAALGISAEQLQAPPAK